MMAFLTGLLAIAAVFVVLATLTTGFVETIHGLARQRQKGLEQTIGAMFDNLFEAEKAVGIDRRSFIDAMTRNPAARIVDPSRIPLFGTMSAGKLDRLDLRQFIEQLANTPIGDQLAARNSGLENRLVEISAAFARYSEGMRELFRRRAGIYSALGGIGLAAFINVDGALLAERLFKDSSLAESIVVQLPPEELRKFMDAEQALAAKCQSGSEADKERCVADGLAKQTLTVGQATLAGLGLPIGRAYFPYCEAPGGSALVDDRCSGLEVPSGTHNSARRFFSNLMTESGLAWLLSIIVTGALIGLGAPFWYELYRKLALFVPVTRKLESVVGAVPRGQEAKADRAGQVQPAALTPADLATIFKLARAK
jgi:hypothetical protein